MRCMLTDGVLKHVACDRSSPIDTDLRFDAGIMDLMVTAACRVTQQQSVKASAMETLQDLDRLAAGTAGSLILPNRTCNKDNFGVKIECPEDEMTEKMTITVNSEIGVLESVLLHAPGPEVENMTPETTQRALYSDVLNLAVVEKEYTVFEHTLSNLTHVLKVKDLLRDILAEDSVKQNLLSAICSREKAEEILPRLLPLPPDEIARLLIEGVVMEKDNLTKYLDRDRYALQPLHNFFFMRDAAVVINDQVMVSRLANPVREREAVIMEAVFAHHPLFKADMVHARCGNSTDPLATIEGGDVLVVREDILVVGQSSRTSTQGIDTLIEHARTRSGPSHIIVQELPYEPESFIHLDMAFTMLDVDCCMVYKPLILESNRFLTIHIRIEHGKVMIREAPNILTLLEKLGMPLTAICCGGENDTYVQDREQWHSGANFFCLAPGKVMGYGRNVFTLDAMSDHGFEIVPATTLTDHRLDLKDRRKVVVTVEGTELARGGGGCRCMTLPLKRSKVKWP